MADVGGSSPRKRRAERVAYRPDGQASAVETGTVEGTSDADWAAFAPLERAETRFIGAYPVSSRLVAGGSTRALTVLGYDPLGRVECTAQRMDPALFGTDTDACVQNSQNGTPDRITKTFRDPAGQVTEVRTAVGTALEAPEVRTTYTANGLVESLTDAEFNHTVYFFDGHDRLRRTQYPVWQRGAGASNPAHYDERTYDAAGNVLTFRNRAGEVTSFGYDALNRLTVRDRPAGATELDTTYGYDLLGRMTRATTNYSLTFAYDALGRQLGQTSPHGTIASQYDAAGRRTRLTWPDGFFVAYDYLTTGEMRTIRENGAASGIGVLATFGYDDLGRRTSLTRGNGILTSYGYDPASRLTSLAHNFGGNGNDVTLSFAHNAASQITSRSGAHNAYAFTSSVAGTRTDTHNGRNEIWTVNGTQITHDARGNLTNDGFRSFAYTSDNLMTQAGGASLFYDPLDRLRFVQGGGNEQLVYDGAELIVEYNMSGTALLRRYVHGPGVDEPLVWYEGSGTADRRWMTADERGSIIGTFNDARGGLGYVAYDEYGRRQVLGTPGRFGFTGQQWLAEIGMYYFRARIYDPDGGRFLQTDPIGYADGMNLYAYVRGDPINSRDPFGLGEAEVCRTTYAGEDGSGRGTSYGPFTICTSFYRHDVSFSTGDAPLGGGGGGGGRGRDRGIGAVAIGGGVGIPDVSEPSGIFCPVTRFTITGVGPRQANSSRRTAISQERGDRIDPRAGSVAINPENFGVPNVGGDRREVFLDIRIYPDWGGATAPIPVPAQPPGLPAEGPYRPIDVIPREQRHPGNQIDLYRYSDQDQAIRSTRSVPVRVLIPSNNVGVICPS